MFESPLQTRLVAGEGGFATKAAVAYPRARSTSASVGQRGPSARVHDTSSSWVQRPVKSAAWEGGSGCGGECEVEGDTAVRQPFECRAGGPRVAVEAQALGPYGIEKEDQHVGHRPGVTRPAGRCSARRRPPTIATAVNPSAPSAAASTLRPRPRTHGIEDFQSARLHAYDSEQHGSGLMEARNTKHDEHRCESGER